MSTTLDGFDQRDYLEGKSEKSARNVFFYYSGATPSAVRYGNWKMYYTMSAPGATGWIMPLVPFHMTLVDNIKRDPFEQAVGQSEDRKWHLRCNWRTSDCLSVRLEHAADRPAALVPRTHVFQGVPADAGAGDLEPGWHPETSAGGGSPKRLAAKQT